MRYAWTGRSLSLPRDLIFLAVVACMIVLAGYHGARSHWFELQIDLAVLAFAVYSWKPWRRFMR
jgi:hypothetical protein